MKVKLLGSRVLVKKLKEADVEIIVPSQFKEELPYGEIVAIGPGYLKENEEDWTPLDVSMGDKVIFHPRAGVNVNLKGIDYKILTEREVLAIIDASDGVELLDSMDNFLNEVNNKDDDVVH